MLPSINSSPKNSANDFALGTRPRPDRRRGPLKAWRRAPRLARRHALPIPAPGQRTIVSLVTYIDGQAFIVATTADLFEVDVIKKRVTLLKFWVDDKKQKLATFEELVEPAPIVAMAVLDPNHTVFVATAKDLFEVNLVTKRVTLLSLWPAEPIRGSVRVGRSTDRSA